MLYALVAPVAVLLPTALAVALPAGRAGLTTNVGAHGFTEILFAFASAFGNNGQNFAGLSANSPFYNVTTPVAMMLGRFALTIPALALAGSLARKVHRRHEGALPTGTPLFGGVVLATAIVMGALTFLPALALGPLADHFTLWMR
jgi:K+-transporting ATPase ATPase A chain